MREMMPLPRRLALGLGVGARVVRSSQSWVVKVVVVMLVVLGSRVKMGVVVGVVAGAGKAVEKLKLFGARLTVWDTPPIMPLMLPLLPN